MPYEDLKKYQLRMEKVKSTNLRKQRGITIGKKRKNIGKPKNNQKEKVVRYFSVFGSKVDEIIKKKRKSQKKMPISKLFQV